MSCKLVWRIQVKYSRTGVGILVCLSLLTALTQGCKSFRQAVLPEIAEQLQPEVAVSRDSERRFWFSVNVEEYFEVALQKSGTEFAFSLSRPDGQLIRSITCSQDGPAKISEVASETGEYVLRVTGCANDGLTRHYNVRVSQPRPATQLDYSRVKAGRLEAEAQSLISEYRESSTRRAIQRYDEAAREWAAGGDTAQEANALNSIARLYRELGDMKSADSYANQALIKSQSKHDATGEAEAYLSRAMIYQTQGDFGKAVDACSKALDIALTAGDRGLEASVEYTRGDIYYNSLNDYEKAAKALDRASEIWASTGNMLGQARALIYRAAVDFDVSRFDAGPDRAQRALSVLKSLGDRRGEGQALILMGFYNLRTGHTQEALNLSEQAKAAIVGSGDLFWEAALFNQIATAYRDLGQHQSALQYFERALSKSEALGDRIGIAGGFWLVGRSHFGTGNYTTGLSYLNRALEAFRALSNDKIEGRILEDLGSAYEFLNKVKEAREVYTRLLELGRRVPDGRFEASALSGLGHILEVSGNTDRALDSYTRALSLNRATKDSFGEIATLYRVAHALRAKERLSESLTNSEAALKLIEGMRSSVANSALRTSYFASTSVREQYELNIDVQMRLHREQGQSSALTGAFEASERSRARNLADSIAETQVSIEDGVDPKLIQRLQALRAQLDTKAERYTQLLGTKSTSRETAELASEIQSLTADYEDVEGQIKTRSPRYAALVKPEPLKLNQIQKGVLDEDSVLLEFAVGEKSSHLWLVTRQEISGHLLPAESEIREKVARFRNLLTAPANKQDSVRKIKEAEVEYPKAAKELSDLLLGPVADKLGTKRLLIVADGALQYLPFAALAVPGGTGNSPFTPLFVKHEIVNLPSASTMDVIRKETRQRGQAKHTIAVIADPVFQNTDSRLARQQERATAGTNPASTEKPAIPAVISQVLRSGETLPTGINLPRLHATGKEANAILAMVPENQRWSALGFDANRAAVMSGDLKQYKFVHFGTHTVLDENHPDLSALVLSLVDRNGRHQNGFLWLRDMYNLKLSAELVVLSACETGIGKEIRGEGLMSMVRGFMYSGTPRVLASLWKVDDEGTSALMTEFYKQLLQNNRTPAAALRQAQLALWQSKSRDLPYYWAGFQLQGEWKK